jgi:hypothetical protein
LEAAFVVVVVVVVFLAPKVFGFVLFAVVVVAIVVPARGGGLPRRGVVFARVVVSADKDEI